MKGIIFWDVTPYSPVKFIDVAEECIASIFGAEEYANRAICNTQEERTAPGKLASDTGL
jgi:hypothetical protein